MRVDGGHDGQAPENAIRYYKVLSTCPIPLYTHHLLKVLISCFFWGGGWVDVYFIRGDPE